MYTYKFLYDNIFCFCSPGGRWKLKSSSPPFCNGTRLELSGELIFVNSDYTYLKQIEETDPFGSIIFVIYKDGVEHWRGKFSPVLCKIDSYKGVFRATPIVHDKYSPIIENWEEEVDVMNVAPRNVEIEKLSGIEEIEISDIINVSGTKVGGVFYPDNIIQWNADPHNSPTPLPQITTNNYFSINQLVHSTYAAPAYFYDPIEEASLPVYAGAYSEFWLFWSAKFEDNITGGVNSKKVTAKLRRKVTYTVNDSSGNPSPPSTFAGYSWLSLGAATVAGYDCTKWVIDPRYLAWTAIFGFKYIIDKNGFWCPKITNGKTKISNGKLLNDILYFFSDRYGGYLMQSTFLLDEFNPITGRKNETNRLIAINNYDLNKDAGELPGENRKMKFKELINNICNTFNMKWDLLIREGTYRFVIEHVDYWNNKYDEFDLTSIENGLYTEKQLDYKYNGSSLPRREHLRFQTESYNVDFDGLPIVYEPQNTSALIEDTTKDISVKMFDTNIDFIIGEKIDKNWSLLSTVKVGEVYNVLLSATLLVGLTFNNEILSNSRLLDDYFKYNRLLPKGEMNGVLTSFEESGYLKEQEKITVPIEIKQAIVWNKYLTELGWGRLDSFEFDSLTRTTSLTIKFKVNV